MDGPRALTTGHAEPAGPADNAGPVRNAEHAEPVGSAEYGGAHAGDHGRSRAVLVTGCSTGIGRATAERLARAGRPVFATARRVATVADLTALGARVLELDVTDEDSMRAAVAAVEAEHGAVGALVNNAGYGLFGPLETTALADVRRQFETNVFGLLRLTQLVLPGMRRQRHGRVVNVSSMGGRFTMPGGGSYHASKYAVEAVSDALRLEVAGFGVAVSLVEPGPVLTPWAETAVETAGAGAEDDGVYAEFRRHLATSLANAYQGPPRRLASSPERVARVVERAISARTPRPRYVVGPVAHGLIAAKRLLPDRVFDRLLSSRHPMPHP